MGRPLRFTHSAFKLSYTPWSSTSAWDSSASFSTLTRLLLRSRPTRTERRGLVDFLGLMVVVFAGEDMLWAREHVLRASGGRGRENGVIRPEKMSVVALRRGSTCLGGSDKRP